MSTHRTSVEPEITTWSLDGERNLQITVSVAPFDGIRYFFWSAPGWTNRRSDVDTIDGPLGILLDHLLLQHPVLGLMSEFLGIVEGES